MRAVFLRVTLLVSLASFTGCMPEISVPVLDAAVADAAIDATPTNDSTPRDAAPTDAAPVDTGAIDATQDAAPTDGTPRDALLDAGTPDASADAHIPTFDAIDGEACDAFDRCVHGLNCVDGRCASTFELLSSWANYADGYVFAGITYRGGDPALSVQGEPLGLGVTDGPVLLDNPEALTIERVRAQPRRPEHVRVINAGEVVAEIAVGDKPVREVGEACARLSGVDACARGSYCRAPADCARRHCVQVEGICTAVDVQAVRYPRQVNVSLTAVGSRPNEPWGYELNGRLGHVRATFDAERADFRLASEGPFRLFHGIDVLVDDVMPVAPDERAEGEACDVRRHLDVCVAGTACTPEGRCAVVSPPTIGDVAFYWPEGAVGLRIAGDDLDEDADRFIATRTDGFHQVSGVFGATSRFWGTAWVERDGARFIAYQSHREDRPRWPLADVRVLDAEGLPSPVAQVAPVDAIADVVPGEIGAPCDYVGVLLPCADGLLCDILDGEPGPRPTCQLPVVECAPAAPILPIDTPVRVEEPVVVAPTALSCGGQVLEVPRVVGRWTFVAPAAGTYRFSAGSRSPTPIAIRAFCALRHSEIGCTPSAADIDGIYLTTIDAPLVAGESVTVVVEYNDWVLIEGVRID